MVSFDLRIAQPNFGFELFLFIYGLVELGKSETFGKWDISHS